MAPLVVPGIARFTVNGTYAGEAVANIIDMFIDTTGGITSRADAIVDQANVILDQWVEDILVNTVDDYAFTSVSWVDMDSLGGTTGEITSTGTNTLPLSGPSTEAPMPAQVAVLVRKLAEGGRNVRNGRLYFIGISESATAVGSANVLQPTAITTLQNAFNTFHTNIDQDAPYESSWRVVHTPAASAPSSTDVVSLQVDELLATQKRRLPART